MGQSFKQIPVLQNINVSSYFKKRFKTNWDILRNGLACIFLQRAIKNRPISGVATYSIINTSANQKDFTTETVQEHTTIALFEWSLTDSNLDSRLMPFFIDQHKIDNPHSTY